MSESVAECTDFRMRSQASKRIGYARVLEPSRQQGIVARSRVAALGPNGPGALVGLLFLDQALRSVP